MEKFHYQKHAQYFEHLPFSYFSAKPYLDFAAFVFERNNEHILVIQDIYFPHEFPSIFMPRKKENWKDCAVTFASEDEIQAVKNENIEIQIQNYLEIEYFYSTKSFIEPKGKFRQRVRQFQKSYNFTLLHQYPKEKILEFYNHWKNQKQRRGNEFKEGEQFFFFGLQNLSRYNIQQTYIEIDGKLAGLAWGVHHQNNGWVGLHLKVDYRYKGLSRYLHHERAKMFPVNTLFTLGTGIHNTNISQYKKELGPVKTKKYFYILTGSKIQ